MAGMVAGRWGATVAFGPGADRCGTPPHASTRYQQVGGAGAGTSRRTGTSGPEAMGPGSATAQPPSSSAAAAPPSTMLPACGGGTRPAIRRPPDGPPQPARSSSRAAAMSRPTQRGVDCRTTSARRRPSARTAGRRYGRRPDGDDDVRGNPLYAYGAGLTGWSSVLWRGALSVFRRAGPVERRLQGGRRSSPVLFPVLRGFSALSGAAVRRRTPSPATHVRRSAQTRGGRHGGFHADSTPAATIRDDHPGRSCRTGPAPHPGYRGGRPVLDTRRAR